MISGETDCRAGLRIPPAALLVSLNADIFACHAFQGHFPAQLNVRGRESTVTA
jgi:hypothetical protein